MRLLNRCDYCGKFRPWRDLIEEEWPHMDLAGHVDFRFAFICSDCWRESPRAKVDPEGVIAALEGVAIP